MYTFSVIKIVDHFISALILCDVLRVRTKSKYLTIDDTNIFS